MDLDSYIGYSKVTSCNSPLWRQLVAEFLGTLFLVLLGCGSTISGWKDGDTSTIIRIAFAFGFAVMIVVEATSHVSGGHVNPAVTVAMLSVHRIELIPALLYIISQMMGATSGAALLMVLTPFELNSTYGANIINERLTVGQGFGVEFFVTFLLILVIFAVTDQYRANVRKTASAAIGASVILGHLFSIPYTGCGMNPARVFASAAITGIWANQWIYWLSECTAALIAATFYVLLLTADEKGIYDHYFNTWCRRSGYTPIDDDDTPNERTSPVPMNDGGSRSATHASPAGNDEASSHYSTTRTSPAETPSQPKAPSPPPEPKAPSPSPPPQPQES